MLEKENVELYNGQAQSTSINGRRSYYHMESMNENTVGWKCSHYQNSMCKARITTVEGEIRVSTLTYFHIVGAASVEKEMGYSSSRASMTTPFATASFG